MHLITVVLIFLTLQNLEPIRSSSTSTSSGDLVYQNEASNRFSDQIKLPKGLKLIYTTDQGLYGIDFDQIQITESAEPKSSVSHYVESVQILGVENASDICVSQSQSGYNNIISYDQKVGNILLHKFDPVSSSIVESKVVYYGGGQDLSMVCSETSKNIIAFLSNPAGEEEIEEKKRQIQFLNLDYSKYADDIDAEALEVSYIPKMGTFVVNCPVQSFLPTDDGIAIALECPQVIFGRLDYSLSGKLTKFSDMMELREQIFKPATKISDIVKQKISENILLFDSKHGVVYKKQKSRFNIIFRHQRLRKYNEMHSVGNLLIFSSKKLNTLLIADLKSHHVKSIKIIYEENSSGNSMQKNQRSRGIISSSILMEAIS
ncbi:MAG: hypothetical protein MHMPM18_001595 [Marteilia pararefringens]